MNEQLNVSLSKDNLEFKVIDNIAILILKNNIFQLITNLSETAELFNLIEQAKSSKKIHSLLITNCSGCLNAAVYTEFLNSVKRESSEDGFQLSSAVARTRQLVNLNNFIRKTMEFDKPIFIGLQGEIATPFFGASLAADFRYAAENTEFSMCHLKMGVHPAGALPYFLPKYVKQANAYEILLSGKNISAPEALRLGLVNKIIPSETFQEECIKNIKDIVDGNESVIKFTKRLLKFSINDLEKYIDFEESYYIGN